MGFVRIAAYRAIAGKQRKFLSLIRRHAPLLRSLEAITENSFLLKSMDGTIIEIIEWKSPAAKKKAMKSEELWELWEGMKLFAVRVKLSSVAETRQIISKFSGI